MRAYKPWWLVGCAPREGDGENREAIREARALDTRDVSPIRFAAWIANRIFTHFKASSSTGPTLRYRNLESKE